MTKIGISLSSFKEESQALLRQLCPGAEVLLNPYGRTMTKSEISEFAKELDGVVAGTEPWDADVFTACSQLKVLSRCGVGMDAVDQQAATQNGVKVFSTPDAPTQAVAELTLGLILGLLRHVPQTHGDIVAGKWQKKMGALLEDKQVGLVGFGRIGQRVGQLVHAFGARVSYCDLQEKSVAYPCQKMTLEEMLEQSDIVSLHASGSGQVLIGEAQLQQMKPGSWLVNVSRGSLVDEAALVASLQSGHLAGAALDVFEKEPYQGPLSKLPQVVLSAHVGSYALETRLKMEKEAVENLVKGLQ